jgi:hypothetical protein
MAMETVEAHEEEQPPESGEKRVGAGCARESFLDIEFAHAKRSYSRKFSRPGKNGL